MKNRQLKFRAWEEEFKMMLPPVDLSSPLQDYKWLGRHDLPIMQFTGLYDKNAKEIYEGDILAYVGFDEKKHKGHVYWDDEEAAFFLKITVGKATFRHSAGHEVIGNIHENADLLKE